jgi:phage baseplate assembly protein W
VREILASPLLPRLMQDGYGNYVVQSLLSASAGTLHEAVVEALRPHLGILRGTPHGKRILQRMGAAAR